MKNRDSVRFEIRNRGWAIWFVGLGLSLAGVPAGGAAECRTDYVNIWYPRGTNSATYTPVATTFYGGADYRQPPTNSQVRIRPSQYGMGIGAMDANSLLGEPLPPPSGADTSQEPTIQSLGGRASAVWIECAREVYATDVGAVQVNWAVPGSTVPYPVIYTISANAAQRPVRLYWTDGMVKAPTVQLPGSPIISTLYYNNQITNNNMVWIDEDSVLHATNNVRGKFVLAYSSKDSEGREFLQGIEVVEVLEPSVNVQSVALGERLLPVSADVYGTDGLSTRITRGMIDQTGDPKSQFVYQHAQGRKRGWLYAIRRTSQPSQVEVYWMAKSKLDVIWPFEVDHYGMDWGPDIQVYARGDPDDLGSPVHFPSALGVELMDYQLPDHHAFLDGSEFSTTGPGYALLKYTSLDDVWFEPVRSVLHSDSSVFDLRNWDWEIGQELEPRVHETHNALALQGGTVRVPDDASRHPRNALTIEAWIHPRAGGWRTIVAKGSDGYGLSLDETDRLRYWIDGNPDHCLASTATLATNQWCHVAVVVQLGPPGLVRFFTNGQPAGLVRTNLAAIGSGGAGDLLLGESDAISTGKFDGVLDEIRLWDHALPISTIADWMSRKVDSSHPDYARLIVSFSLDEGTGYECTGDTPDEPMRGALVGNIDWVSSGAPRYLGASAVAAYRDWPGYVYTPYGDGYDVNLYAYPTGAANPPPVSQVYAVNTDLLEVWWASKSRIEDLPEPVYWPSLVNRYRNAWPVEPPEIVIASQLGNESATFETSLAKCLKFDGTDDFVGVPDSPSLRLADSFTLEAWVYPTATAGQYTLFSKGNDEYTLQLREGRLGFYDGLSGQWRLSTRTVHANEWSHVAVTFAAGSGGLRFFVKGDPAGQTDVAIPPSGTVTEGDFSILPANARLFGDAARSEDSKSVLLVPNTASKQGSLVFEMPASGQVGRSFVAEWQYKLTAGTTDGGDGYSFCYGDVPSYSFGEQGAGSGLKVKVLTYGTDRVEVWHGTNKLGAATYAQPFGAWTAARVEVRAASDATATHEVRVQIGEVVVLDWMAVPGWWPLASWRFGFGARNGSAYQADELGSVRIETDAEAPLPKGTGMLAIGKRAPGYGDTDFFKGSIDEIRLWSRVRSPDEIQADIYTWVDPYDPDLCAYYYFDLDDIQGDEIPDWSGFANDATNVGAEQVEPGVPWLNPGVSFAGASPVIYYQNDPALPGYNPNDEHALVLGERAYALRDDLSPEPYVLVEHSPAEVKPRHALAVFKVVRTNEIYALRKDVVAGTMLQAPLPISLLNPANCAENYSYSTTNIACRTFTICFDFFWGRNCHEITQCTTNVRQEVWFDRKDNAWAYAAADDGGPRTITMKYYYPVLDGFYFPFLEPDRQPEVGDHVPWLSGQTIAGEPADYKFTVRWPEDAPVLNMVGTLIEARDGLPAIRGQKSVNIVYQQSVHQTGQWSVELIDPTVAQEAPIESIASDIESYVDPATGYTHFADLPPDLRDRLYYDPSDQHLKIVGNYKTLTDIEFNYLQLNLLTDKNRDAARNISGADDAWREAIDALPQEPVVLTDDVTPFDSLALSAGVAEGMGFVTLIFNDSTNSDMVQESDVIEMTVIRVAPPPYTGKLDLILSDNPLDQQLNIRYTADFSGKPYLYEFEWQFASGSSPDNWLNFETAQGRECIAVGDAGIFGLSDHWIRCRYRAWAPQVQSVLGVDWSEWTPPVLAEGWIKRVLKAITPFEQRIKDFRHSLLTTLDMVAQAGPPYAGDVPLNLDALNQNGLIAIYQTILEKGRKLSIDYGFNDPDVNRALLLAAGRLSDLYIVLGNEAYADALDPTIGLGASDPVWGRTAPSIFAFMNQVPTLLEEELALLHGRDDSTYPGVESYPVYNRLFWNFTKDIAGGEVAYALNYDVRDANGNLDGFITEADAQALYPQGHGDAWGHYLSAVKGYYALLHNTNFAWLPQTEAINVGTEPVSVSFLHEQRFCQSAAAKARAGTRILDATYRSRYAGDGEDTWELMRDSNTNRAWGLGEWSSRAGMGAYFDWLVGNALLPDRDTDPDHSGIRLIDRQTVPELPEIAANYFEVQRQIDHADGGFNPLGLANGVIPFDISPADIDAGETHFEQVYRRALGAWRNALGVFDHVRFNAQALRNQSQSLESFKLSVQEAEIAFTNQLIEIYGYPYADDIGAGKPYPQGYQGPDLLHYNYIDLQDLTGFSPTGREIEIEIETAELVDANASPRTLAYETNHVAFFVADQGLPSRPDSFHGQRRAEGRLQITLGNYVQAYVDMKRALAEYNHLTEEIELQCDLLNTKSDKLNAIVSRIGEKLTKFEDKNKEIRPREHAANALELSAEVAHKTAEAIAEGIRKDWEFGASGKIKSIVLFTGTLVYAALGGGSVDLEHQVLQREHDKEELEIEVEKAIAGYERDIEVAQDLNELKILIASQHAKELELQAAIAAADGARMEYVATLAEGQRLEVARQVFRANTAGRLQADRYRNMAFRIFRNDALDKYEAAFDLAARYVYLAVKAYDYETALPVATDSSLSGRTLLAQVVRARTLGAYTIVNETFNLPEPITSGAEGDPGLADILARLKANWEVLEGRYGYNNPETETGRFSLRTELFRYAPGDEGDAAWRAKLTACRVANLSSVPEFKRYCLPFDPLTDSEPALVIPFSTTVQFRKNFFGHDLAAGDNAYDSSHFASKIRSVGVWFKGFNNVFTNQGLANMPRVYLVPVGLDITRVPSPTNTRIRTWSVYDQALPVPYPLTQDDLENPNWIPLQDSLDGGFGQMRKYPALRAYHDAGFSENEMTGSSRLVGRSVWNTQWLLIIPGGTLLADATLGLDRFIKGNGADETGVEDILIFFQTYSYAGN